ncbi:unnamed protein product [Lymnaea stagnalis]|uniref:Uncharacterized protein n=1 Tax=Lymnaea stagnalis TaxID=6523 RepID=A0AAV2I8K3_LYMST
MWKETFVCVLFLGWSVAQQHAGLDPPGSIECFHCDTHARHFPGCLSEPVTCHADEVCSISYGPDLPTSKCQRANDCTREVAHPIRNCAGGGVEIHPSQCQLCCHTTTCVHNINHHLLQVSTRQGILCPGTCSERDIATCIKTAVYCHGDQFCEIGINEQLVVHGHCKVKANLQTCRNDKAAHPCPLAIGQAGHTAKCVWDCCQTIDCLTGHFGAYMGLSSHSQTTVHPPNTTPKPTTPKPTTPKPITHKPTTTAPTTPKPTTHKPTTPKPTTHKPTTPAPTTPKPTTHKPTTPAPTTPKPTTPAPTTQKPTTPAPTTPKPTTPVPTTPKPTTPAPTTPKPTTPAPTTPKPTTQAPTTPAPTTPSPTTPSPTTQAPTTPSPTKPAPTTPAPTTPAPASSTAKADTTLTCVRCDGTCTNNEIDVTCPDGFCSLTVQDGMGGSRAIKKGCSNQNKCMMFWMEWSSDQLCQNIIGNPGNPSYQDVSCTFCCTGERCNADFTQMNVFRGVRK